MAGAASHVLGRSEGMPEGTPEVRGYDFEGGLDLQALLDAFATTGFQATCFGQAVAEVRRMLRWRLADEPVGREAEVDPAYARPEVRAATRTKIFLGYTSNLISSGVREALRFLCKHRLVDVLVTTAGGVEEDIIKCLGPTYLGDFALRGKELRAKGLNRIGNLIVPNNNYCAFEDFMNPILDAMLAEQRADGVVWTPSKFIRRLGREINDESSVAYWAYKNDIPIYCPALTDGSIGDMLYFHSFRSPGLVLDIVGDIRGMNNEAMEAAPRKTGMLVLGGGLPKHHINNANLMKNGADFSVCISTAQMFDGSDSGANPDEAVSWGKIRADATPVKVCGEGHPHLPPPGGPDVRRQGRAGVRGGAGRQRGGGRGGGSGVTTTPFSQPHTRTPPSRA